jgi:O-antigen ligase
VTLDSIQKKGVLLTPILFVLFVFFIPLSPSIKSIFFALGVASVLFNPLYNQYLLYAYNTYWGRTALFFVLFIAVACFWSPAPFSLRLSVLSKYSKLLYLPILAVGFINARTRTWCINAFILSMLVTCGASFLKLMGWIHIGVNARDPGTLFYNHIITGFMMAIACYLAAFMAVKYKGWLRIAYAATVVITSYQTLFMSEGRTGYIIYILLMGLFLIQKLPLKKAVLGLFLFAMMVLLAFSFSPLMQNGMKDLINNVSTATLKMKSAPFSEERNSNSLSYRLLFHDYAKTLFMRSPVVGLGTGSFQYQYSQEQPYASIWGPQLNDPHGQYWLTLAEQGIIGALFLFLFLGSLFFAACQLKENKALLIGVLIAFCVSAMFDSILCYSTAGYLLIIVSALCFGEFIEEYAMQKDRKFKQVVECEAQGIPS